ncbi:MAG: hypothetical protein F6K39_11460 [Okeania sp. SIO3B3]|nr:hypothetical protein [Okeania sp. SIO3B3]
MEFWANNNTGKKSFRKESERKCLERLISARTKKRKSSKCNRPKGVKRDFGVIPVPLNSLYESILDLLAEEKGDLKLDSRQRSDSA